MIKEIRKALTFDEDAVCRIMNARENRFTFLAEKFAGLNPGVDFRNTDLKGISIFPDECLDGYDFRGACLHRASFEKVDLRRVNLSGADLSNATLKMANLSGLDLRSTIFNNTNLENADLTDASFDRSQFNSSNIKGARISRHRAVGYETSPSYVWDDRDGLLTFIIPAFGAAQIDKSDTLWAGDFGRLVRQVISSRPVEGVCIQGYEPLLPDTFPYTRVIMATCKWLGMPVSFVTNGIHLAQWIDELAILVPARILVSLDAAEADAHDRQRGKQGAFDQAVEGLRLAAAGLASETELVVTSVLLPRRRAQLDAMPELLRKVGVKGWVVTALQKVGENRPVGEREKNLADLRILRSHAEAAGIDFKVDDEFAWLDSPNGQTEDGFERNRIRRLISPDGVYRLVPDGRSSKGADILKPLTDRTPRWDPRTMSAAEFLASLDRGSDVTKKP